MIAAAFACTLPTARVYLGPSPADLVPYPSASDERPRHP
jgi:hypothetical protein